MNTDFPRILTLLRKERGISQKEAAGQLGISQALLSHYEKGIRECGLDFLVRVCDFYKVSCDYLLGRSPDRSNMALSLEELPEADGFPTDHVPVPALSGNAQVARYKKVIVGSIGILFDLLRKCGNRMLTNEASLYLMLCVYKLFRILYFSNPKNQAGLFTLPESLSGQYAEAMMHICEGKCSAIGKGERADYLETIADMDSLYLTTESMSDEYPQYAPCLMRLIQIVEDKLAPYTTGEL